MERDSLPKTLLLMLGITLLAVLVHGYYLGVEDQAVYPPGIKNNWTRGCIPTTPISSWCSYRRRCSTS